MYVFNVHEESDVYWKIGLKYVHFYTNWSWWYREIMIKSKFHLNRINKLNAVYTQIDSLTISEDLINLSEKLNIKVSKILLIY